MLNFRANFCKIFVVAVWFSNADSKGSPWDWQSGNAKYPTSNGYDDPKQDEEVWKKHLMENGPMAITLHSNVTVSVGGTVQLPCRIKNLGEYTVSWLRGRDTSVLSVGHLTFSSSERFRVVTTSNPALGVVDWNLEIKDITLKDAGMYDCQVNTSPKISNKSYLIVTEFDPLAVQVEKQQDSPIQHGQVIPQIQEFLLRGAGVRAEIAGPSVIHLPPGGALSLECTISRIDAVPTAIHWKYGERILTPKDRKGISLESDRQGGTCKSKLVILEVKPGDQGTYSCVSEGAKPASVDLFIDNFVGKTDPENPRALAQVFQDDEGQSTTCQIQACQKLIDELQIKIFNIERNMYAQLNLIKEKVEYEDTDSDGAEALASRVSSSTNPVSTFLLLVVLLSIINFLSTHLVARAT